MDICSFKQVVVDEFSDYTHSFFLKRRSDQMQIMLIWIRSMSKKHTLKLRGSDLTTVVKTEACKKNVTKLIWELLLS